MGIGDWGLGIGDWGLGPIPNPQSPIPIILELRVTQKYDGIIKNIQEDLESLTIKIGLGP